jgi:excisionase family DNA binding protein
MREERVTPGRLLRADQVRQMLGVDRSTIYRMAENGRLPAMKVGRQWRFPADQIDRLFPANGRDRGELPRDRQALALVTRAALPVIEVTAEILGVMMILTDMAGEPLTEVVNPCPWYTEHEAEPDLLEACRQEWKRLAQDPDFRPRFRPGPLAFDRARAFVRAGPRLVAMLVADGVAATDDDPRALYRLSTQERARVLAALPVIAARTSRLAAEYLSDLNDRSKA